MEKGKMTFRFDRSGKVTANKPQTGEIAEIPAVSGGVLTAPAGRSGGDRDRDDLAVRNGLESHIEGTSPLTGSGGWPGSTSESGSAMKGRPVLEEMEGGKRKLTLADEAYGEVLQGPSSGGGYRNRRHERTDAAYGTDRSGWNEPGEWGTSRQYRLEQRDSGKDSGQLDVHQRHIGEASFGQREQEQRGFEPHEFGQPEFGEGKWAFSDEDRRFFTDPRPSSALWEQGHAGDVKDSSLYGWEEASQDGHRNRVRWDNGGAGQRKPDTRERAGFGQGEKERWMDEEIDEFRAPERNWGETPAASGFGDYGGGYRTRRSPNWWKFMLSVAGAAVIGISLGYAALSFINSYTGSQEQGGAVTQAVQTAGPDQEGAGAAAGTVAVQMPAQTLYLLQYGLFSTGEGAAQAEQQLNAAGLASLIDSADGIRVYAGISSDRETAKLLGTNLGAHGIELYVREVQLPALEHAAYAGDGSAVGEYFRRSEGLLSQLSGLSAAMLSSGGPVSEAELAAVTDSHLAWSESVQALGAGLTSEQALLLPRLEKETTRAVSALNEYAQNQAAPLLWEVQTALLNYMSVTKELLAALTPSAT